MNKLNIKLRRWTNGIGLALIHLGALGALLPGMTSWSSVLMAILVLHVTGGLGITLCYHRVLTHRSLRLRKSVEYALALLGTLALQGDPIRWVAIHRKHHAHADRAGDPHGRDRGFAWSHVDWLYKPNDALADESELSRFVPDLQSEQFYRLLPYLQWLAQAAFVGLLLVCGGWSWIVWGIFVRLVVSYHITWFVNSAAHSLGYRSYTTRDRSTNCWWVAVLAWGEGWHNNHHAFPYSARHGLKWFEFDPTWLSVRVLKFLRMADSIKLPPRSALEQKSVTL